MFPANVQQQHAADMNQFDVEKTLRNDKESFNTLRTLSPECYRFRVAVLKGRTFATGQTPALVMVGPGRHSGSMTMHVYIVANLSRIIVTAGSTTGMRLHSPLKPLRNTLDGYQISYVIDDGCV